MPLVVFVLYISTVANMMAIRTCKFTLEKFNVDKLLIKVIRKAVPRNNFKRCLFYLYFVAATCFRPCWPSSGGIDNYFRKLLHLQRIRSFELLGPIFMCLANSAVVCLMCVYELSKRGQITSLLNVKNLKMSTY
jgi:hypothetical protein